MLNESGPSNEETLLDTNNDGPSTTPRPPKTDRFASQYISRIIRLRFWILGFWVIMFFVGSYFALGFMQAVVLKYDPPPGTPGDTAQTLFKEQFPHSSHETDTIVVVASDDGSSVVSRPGVEAFFQALNHSVVDWGLEDLDHPTTFRVMHYFFLANDVGANFTAQSLVSNATHPEASISTFATIQIVNEGFKQGSQKGNTFVDWLKGELGRLAEKHIHDDHVTALATGFMCFANDMQEGTEHDMIIMDGLTFPFALAVLALMLRSFRLLVIPVVNILCTITMAFSLMYPVALKMDVIAVCPSVMMSAAIAFSIDYSLFLLSRYREEIMKGSSSVHAVTVMVESAGHTIMVSGATIALCWFGLMVFPVVLLSTVGLGAGMTVVTTFFVNITLTPALLLTFHGFFSNFNGCGCRGCCQPGCCTPVENEGVMNSSSRVTDNYTILEGQPELHTAIPPLSPSTYDAWGRTSVRSPEVLNNDANDDMPANGPLSPITPRLPPLDGSDTNHLPAFGTIDPAEEVKFLRENSFWFKCGDKCFGTPLKALIASFCVIVPIFAIFTKDAVSFHHSESFTLFTPRGSDSTKATQIMEASFGGGRIAPYSLLVKSKPGVSVLSNEFFHDMQDTVENVVLRIGEDDEDMHSNPPLSANGISGMMYLRGHNVDFTGKGKETVTGCVVKVVETFAESTLKSCVVEKCSDAYTACQNSDSCSKVLECLPKCDPDDLECFAMCKPWNAFSLGLCGVNKCLLNKIHSRPDTHARRLLSSEAGEDSMVEGGEDSMVEGGQDSMAEGGQGAPINVGQQPQPLTSAAAKTPDCFSVLLQVVQQVNVHGDDIETLKLSKYSWLTLELNVDPFSQVGSNWLKAARTALDARSETDGYEYYLAGGDVAGHDTVEKVFELFPITAVIICVVVFVLVGIAFKSVVVPIRALFTIAVTLTLVYGSGVAVYEHDALKWLGFQGLINPVPGQLSWLVPAMMFAVLVGLSLDYDIFLIVRIVEYREAGFTDFDSVMCGLAQTGSVITGAGLIMTLAFAGLLLSSNPALNQMSFFLVVAVVTDTFVVRTILVPSLMILLGRFNWYPRKLPVVDY